MKMFALFDKDGLPAGFYTPDVHKEIPKGVIEITEAQWQEFLNNQGRRRWDGEKVVAYDPPPDDGPNKFEGFNKYFLALGRFIHEFSQVESFLKTILWSQSKTDIDVAMSIFSDLNTDKTIEYIKKIRKSKKLPLPEELESAFKQFNEIKSSRNIIVHNSVTMQKDASFIAKKITCAAYQPKEIKISPQTLDDMTADLKTINNKLAVFMLKGSAPDEFINKGFGPASQAPWRYKSPKKTSPGKNSKKTDKT